jgi:probable rRNA maturation factor
MPDIPKIRFISEGQKVSPGLQSRVKNWLSKIARTNKKRIGTLNYIFVNDDYLLAMNRHYLRHDTLTDIITFDYSSDEKSKNTISGEIYISIDRVRENAEKFGVKEKDELHRVMAHGLLHLCGFRDKSLSEKKRMRSQEEKALALR